MSFEKKLISEKKTKFKKSWDIFFEKNPKILKNSKFLEFFQKNFFAQNNVIWSVKYKKHDQIAPGTLFVALPMCNYLQVYPQVMRNNHWFFENEYRGSKPVVVPENCEVVRRNNDNNN